MAAVDVDLMESVQVQVPGALLVVRSIKYTYISNNILRYTLYLQLPGH